MNSSALIQYVKRCLFQDREDCFSLYQPNSWPTLAPVRPTTVAPSQKYPKLKKVVFHLQIPDNSNITSHDSVA